MNGLRKCGTYMQWNFTQPQRRKKFCHSQINGWNWRLRRTKAACSLSYAGYSLKTPILWDMGHTKGRPCKGGTLQGKETKNLNVVDVFTVQE
jgi:hypothetical protein